MLFELETVDGGLIELIIWPDANGNGTDTSPAHPDRTLMDVGAGDVIIHHRTAYDVRRVKPYRATDCRDETEYPWVACGRDYEQSASARSGSPRRNPHK